jgi:hypothetical protein
MSCRPNVLSAKPLSVKRLSVLATRSVTESIDESIKNATWCWTTWGRYMHHALYRISEGEVISIFSKSNLVHALVVLIASYYNISYLSKGKKYLCLPCNGTLNGILAFVTSTKHTVCVTCCFWLTGQNNYSWIFTHFVQRNTQFYRIYQNQQWLSYQN